jgi:two-component system sensor histidine kinase ChiS
MLKLILILISVFLFTCNKKEKLNLPLVEKGLIDLSDWDFEKEAKLNLDGEWLFSYNNLVFYPKDNQDLEKFNFVNVPSSWTNYTL